MSEDEASAIPESHRGDEEGQQFKPEASPDNEASPRLETAASSEGEGESKGEKRRRQRWLLAIATFVALLLLSVWGSLFISSHVREPSPELPPSSAALQGFAQNFPRQGANECGAFSLARGLQAKMKGAPKPKAVVAEISGIFSWSETLSGTRPWSLEQALARRGFVGQGFSGLRVAPEERLRRLQSHVARGHPVIVLIRNERGVQHYVLVVGYSAGRIDIYDPALGELQPGDGQTPDENGSRPGNRSHDAKEFEAMWSGGGLLGLFRWWYLPIIRVRAGAALLR